VEGQIQTRSYDAQDGSKRYVTEIIADHVEGLSSPNTDHGPTPPPGRDDRQPEEPENEDFTEVDPGDELPF
jgi:single-strand DNA-binding protein